MPEQVDRATRRLLGKLDDHLAEIERYEATFSADAEVLVVAYGITARASRAAVRSARDQGIKAGLFRPITLWPFPETALLEAAAAARAVLVPEMNAGQLVLEIERLLGHGKAVAGVNRIDGEPIVPSEILTRIQKVTSHG